MTDKGSQLAFKAITRVCLGFSWQKSVLTFTKQSGWWMKWMIFFIFLPCLPPPDNTWQPGTCQGKQIWLCFKVKDIPHNVGIPGLMYIYIYTRPTPTFRGLTMGLAEACCCETARHIGLWPFGPVSSPQTSSSNECLLILLPLSPLGRQPFASAKVD